MTLDLTRYLPQPFTMTAGDYTIVSPVPDVRAGKIIAAWQAVLAEQARRLETGEPQLTGPIDGWPTDDEELADLLLGPGEYQRLISEGAPPVFISQAVICAVVYWANGGSEDAVTAFLDATTNPAAGPTSGETTGAGPKGRKPSKTGRRTASANRPQ